MRRSIILCPTILMGEVFKQERNRSLGSNRRNAGNCLPCNQSSTNSESIHSENGENACRVTELANK